MADPQKPKPPESGTSEYPKVDREAHRSKLSEHDADQIDEALKKIKEITDANKIEKLHIHTFSAQFIDPHQGPGGHS